MGDIVPLQRGISRHSTPCHQRNLHNQPTLSRSSLSLAIYSRITNRICLKSDEAGSSLSFRFGIPGFEWAELSGLGQSTTPNAPIENARIGWRLKRTYILPATANHHKGPARNSCTLSSPWWRWRARSGRNRPHQVRKLQPKNIPQLPACSGARGWSV